MQSVSQLNLQTMTKAIVRSSTGGRCRSDKLSYFFLRSSVRRLSLSLVSLALAACGARDISPEGSFGSGALSLGGVSFQTVLGGQFIGAQNNGGGAIDATASTVQAWEMFSLIDVNGGSLQSGDSVFIQAGNGQFFQAVNGGGSTLNASSNNRVQWETFKIVKQNGSGDINNGDVVGLQGFSGSWVSAQNGGGGPVLAYGGAQGLWEQLKISGLSAGGSAPSMAPPPPPSHSNGGSAVKGVSFRTQMRATFLNAQNNGGGAVVASATTAQDWETFTLIDVNGGTLDSGDSVYIQAGGGQFFRATNGGTQAVDAAAPDQSTATPFKIVKQAGGGTLKTGDIVGLQSPFGTFVSAENGGGGNVFDYGAALGPWEALAIGIGAPAGGNPPAEGGSGPAPAGWRLVWSDEFDGNGLDGSKWNIEQHGPGWVNHELEAYTARSENLRVENGHLVIEARHDFAGGGEYSSARINTAGHASWTFGRMEARIQLSGGFGTWPGFWMMPNNMSRGWPGCGEIDIMEEVGFEGETVHGTTHTACCNGMNGTQRGGGTAAPGSTTGYHIYAVEWSPSRVDFFFDNNRYYGMANDGRGDDSWPFNQDFYLIFNVAIGGDWGGAKGVDPNIWPRQMLVDYVRVYER
jgi:hypothetical protein